MNPLRRTAFVALLAACSVTVAAAAAPQARAAGLEELLNGKDTPVSLALKDLTPEWRRIVVREPSTRASERMTKMMAASMLGGGSSSVPSGMESLMFTSLFGGGGAGAAMTEEVAYYTRGRVVALGSETFLVAYRPDRRGLNLGDILQHAVLPGGADAKPDVKKLLADARITPESRLSLALLNVRNLGSLSGVRPVDVEAEVADLSRDNAFFEAIAKADEAEEAKRGAAGAAAPSGFSLAEMVEGALTQQDAQLSAPGNSVRVEERPGGVLVLKGHVKSAALQARAANVARRLLAEQAADGLGAGVRIVNQLAVKAGP